MKNYAKIKEVKESQKLQELTSTESKLANGGLMATVLYGIHIPIIDIIRRIGEILY
jgi:hypothetical protein